MARRPDVLDRMLEHWASWRLTSELYEGTGPSAIVRFTEPAGTALTGSRPLFMGFTSRRLAALNADLLVRLGGIKVNLLLTLYGLPGEDTYKSRRFGFSLSSLNKTRKQARGVALQHASLQTRIGGDYDQRRTEAAG